MKPTFITPEVLVVELPEGAHSLDIKNTPHPRLILYKKVTVPSMYWTGGTDEIIVQSARPWLPPDYTYELIGTDLSEWQAAGIVENGKMVYLTDKHYHHYIKNTYVTSALESLRSLEVSKGITSKNKVYLKAKKN